MRFRSVLVSCFVVFFINLFFVKFVHAQSPSPTSFSKTIKQLQKDHFYNTVSPSANTSAYQVNFMVQGACVKALANSAAEFAFKLGEKDQFNITWNDGTQTELMNEKVPVALRYIQKSNLGAAIDVDISGKNISGNFGGYDKRGDTYYIFIYGLNNDVPTHSNAALNLKFSKIS